MARYLLISLFVFFIFANSNGLVFAESSYVLPYPSFMPGNKLYIISEIKDKLSKYFYFGDFGKFKYNLSQADKYLVEAKTLFEYKQYLLGYKSLQKSNEYFTNIKSNLVNAKNSGKNIEDKEKNLTEASFKHVEVLEKMKEDVPETFEWIPEKASPTTLYLKKQIEDAIEIRH